MIIRQRILGLCGGFEDCARLGMAEFYKRWLKLDIYGGQGLCNNYKLHLVFA